MIDDSDDNWSSINMFNIITMNLMMFVHPPRAMRWRVLRPE